MKKMNILRILVLSVMIIFTRQEKVKHKQKQYFERYIPGITRLMLFVQQREEILQLKHSVEQLKMDMMILNGSLEILLNQQRDKVLQNNNNEVDLKSLNESLNIPHDKGQADQGNPSEKAPSMENEREHPRPSTTSTILTTVTNKSPNSKILQTSVSTTLVPPTFTVPVSVYGASSCHLNWIQHGTSCYLFTTEEETWADAVNHCTALGAHLAEIQTAEEDHFISDHLQNIVKSGRSYWLGGTDIAAHGHFEWVHSRTPLTYTNWAPKEPYLGLAYQCIQLWAEKLYLWDDYHCDRSRRFICEEDLDEAILG